MRIPIRVLATFGAICLLLVVYSVARSPSGTKMALQFVTLWWAEPFAGETEGNQSSQDDIVKNPIHESVAGLKINPSLTILFQSEERVAFNGDGHTIIVAGPSGSREEFLKLTSELKWNRVEAGILNYLQFLKDTTPYASASDKIDPILNDPAAVYFLEDLKRNGTTMTNLTIYILSPSTQRILEWSSDF